jgi:DNA repair protein RecO (recombination protein O)
MSYARRLPISTQAIVVGVRAFKEADRMVDLLTPEHGRLTAIARNARKSQRRYGAALDLGNRIEASLRPPRGTLWALDEAMVLDGRKRAHCCLDRLSLLAYCAEVCGRLAREQHPEPRLYGLLDMAATLLDAMEGAPSAQFRIGFEAKALTFAGVTPVLDACVACAEPPAAPMVIVPHAGGAHHAGCLVGGGQAVSLDWLAAAELARRSPLRSSIDAPSPPGPRWCLAGGIEAHLGSGLRSRGVLASIGSSAPAPTG